MVGDQMLKIIAIGINPRINDVERDRIQEWLDGTHPMSSHRNYYDSGTPRKSKLLHLDQSGVGPNEIPREKDDRSSMSDVSSGYNRGLDPGGQADDETGPGNSKQVQETDPNKTNQRFMTEGEISNFLFRNEDSAKRDRKTRSELSTIRGKSYGPPPQSGRWERHF